MQPMWHLHRITICQGHSAGMNSTKQFQMVLPHSESCFSVSKPLQQLKLPIMTCNWH